MNFFKKNKNNYKSKEYITHKFYLNFNKKYFFVFNSFVLLTSTENAIFGEYENTIYYFIQKLNTNF